MPHINEKIDFTVEVFLVYKNKILIRKHDKYNVKTGVGGHIESGEDPVQAAIREVKEETGLDLILNETLKISNEKGDLIPPFAINRHRISNTHEHVGLFYCGEVKSSLIVQRDGEVSDDIQWLTKEELRSLSDISENVRTYALRALELVGKNKG